MILMIKHTITEGPGLLFEAFEKRGLKTCVVEFENGGVLPDSLKGLDAVVTLGGPMNVYEEEKYPFLKDENSFLKEAFNKEIPVLGICLGGQLMAKAAGAKVTRAKEKEVGWYELNLNAAGIVDPLFNGTDSVLPVLQWHGDRFDVPSGGVLLCENDICPQVFRLGTRSYGFQCHFEVTPAMVRDWMSAENNPDVTPARSAQILLQAKTIYPRFLSQSEKMISNFIKLI